MIVSIALKHKGEGEANVRISLRIRCYLLHKDVSDNVHSKEHPEERYEVEDGEEAAVHCRQTR